MTNNNNNYKEPLECPNNIDLPFFAYGIFKPGQLAYPKIKNHVEEHMDNIKINYEMRHRDGVPILLDKETDYHHTKGSIITFNEDCKKDAYNIISKTLLKKLYKWKTIKINGNEVNILFGVKPKRGSDYIEDKEERVNFNGKNDPFFDEAIKLIEKNLNSNKFSWDMTNFFELQMNYMLLWSAIDRYSSLKYNGSTKKDNNIMFSEEKAFIEGIKKYKDTQHIPVYSTEDLRLYKFKEENPYHTLNYYYTLRCNVVHRGKAMVGDYGMLKTALKELLEIFKDIINDTFDENDL